MVTNFPGPYELRFSYDTTPVGQVQLNHTARLNVDLVTDPPPGTAFALINAKTRGGVATPDLATVVEAWLALWVEIMHTSSNFGLVELWKYTPLTFQADFVSSYSPIIVAGLHTLSPGVCQQDILTFRTTEGGILRLNSMEARNRDFDRIKFPTGIGNVDAIFNFVVSDPNWILGRDTSYPFGGLNYLIGQNEKLFRIRFR